jgi:hypothetical protein
MTVFYAAVPFAADRRRAARSGSASKFRHCDAKKLTAGKARRRPVFDMASPPTNR